MSNMQGVFSTIPTASVYRFVIFVALLREQATACQDNTVGLEDSSIIPDDRFTASTYYDYRYEAKYARLNSNIGFGWGPKRNDQNDYLQIDLGQVFVICAVATQGCATATIDNNKFNNEWTTQYKISASIDNTTWTTYKDGNTDKLFTGNTDRNTVVKNVLSVPILVRIIRFIPTDYTEHKLLRVEAYGFKQDLPCRSLPVGVEDGNIPDSDMTSSSTYNSTTSPSKARLNYTSGSSWCAATSDSSPYIQINLGSPHIICGIATQGDHMTDQWVQSYEMFTSTDGSTFKKYMENGQVKSFSGNFNSNTTVKNLLYDGTVSQYVRVTPTSHYGSTNCMRTELYGMKKDGGCSSISGGLSYSSIIPDHRFTASSSYGGHYKPQNARLLTSNKAWVGSTKTGEWLQIDLGSVVYVCAVATQGAGDFANEFAEKYKIRVSLDNVNWNYYQENNIDKEFTGNTDRYTVVINSLTEPNKAKFIRFYPSRDGQWPSMRAEVYGISSACSSPVGLEKGVVWDIQSMTSSSHLDSSHTASRGRLYGDDSWCSNTSSNTEFIQIHLGQVMTLTGIATQGDQTLDKWVRTYTISYSMDGTRWNTYKAGLNTNKTFDGNSDKNSIVVRWLSHPLTARYVRVAPQTWNTAICMRIELYGCNYPIRPEISGLSNQNLTASANGYVDLVCRVQEPLIQHIKWFTGNNDITSRSSGLVRGVNAVWSTLRVNYTSTDDVYNTYSCFKSSTVWCFKPYICRVMYGSTKTGADGMKSAGIERTLPPSKPPTNFRVITLTSTSVQVSWDLPSQNSLFGVLKGFKIHYQKVNGSVPVVTDFPGRGISYKIDGLEKYTKYLFKVLAYTIQEGLYSNAVTIQTMEDAPSLPRGLRAIVIDPTANRGPQVQLTWNVPAFANGIIRAYIVSHGHQESSSVTAKTTVDGARKTVTLPVLGGVNYWFRVRAVTIKEGKDTSKVQIYIKIYVPRSSPRIISISKKGLSTFVVSWQQIPRDEANGIITKYQIKWTKFKMDEPASNPTVNFKTVNSTLSQTTLENLGQCSRYNVSIQGYTVAGHGPFSNPTTLLTSAPSAPQQLSKRAAEKREVALEWNAPPVTESIEKYIIALRGTKDYNNSFLHSDEKKSKNALSKFRVDNLYPDTNYKFQVSAITKCGIGEESNALTVTTKVDAPPAPPVPFPPINITSSRPKITLWPASNINGEIWAYQVIVKEIVSSPQMDETRLHDYKKAQKDGLHYYVTAQIAAKELPNEFVIGDGKLYGKFENVKLDEDKQYEIVERALTQDKEKYLAGPMTVIARSQYKLDKRSERVVLKSDNKTPNRPTTGLSVAVSLLALTVVIIIVLVVYILKLKKKIRNTNATERSPSRSETRLADFSMEERLSSYICDASRHLANPSQDIITEDMYEQIDSEWRPKRQNNPNQSSNFNSPRATNIKMVTDENMPSLDRATNAQPEVCINEEEYNYVDQSLGKEAKTVKSLVTEGVLDASAIPTDVVEPDFDSDCYEDVNTSTKRNPKGRSNESEENGDSRVYTECEPVDQREYQLINPDSVNLLAAASDTGHYKNLNSHRNVGYKSQEEESFS